MIATLMWKEYREQRALWLAIALLAVILTVVLAATLGRGDLLTAFQDDTFMGAFLGVVFCLSHAYGVVCGALLVAGEKEGNTLTFLDVHTGQRAPLWQTKLAAGLLLTSAQGLFLGGLSLMVFGFASWKFPASWEYPVGMWIFGLVALMWGLLGGTLVGSVFPSVLLGIALLSGSWLLATFAGELWQPMAPVVALGLAVVAARVSWQRFCAPDLARRQAPQPEARRRVRLLPASWLVFLWLCARQGRLQLGITLAGCVVLGIMLPQAPLYVWPIGTLLLGLSCGLAVFGYEQSGGQGQFLAAQRLPAGTFWTIKTLFWLFTAFVLTGLIWIVAGIQEVMAIAYNPPTLSANQEWWKIWFGKGWVIRQDNLPLFLAQWVFQGFAFGLVCSLLTRKMVVAAVLSLGSSVLVLGLWLPSLICGGLEMWQVLLMPLAFVGMSRLVIWPWLCGRLISLRPLVILAGGTLASLCWLGGNLWYRAVEVPEVGEPFDLRAYYAELDQLGKNPAGLLINQALLEMVDNNNQLNKKMGRPMHLIFTQEKDFWSQYHIKPDELVYNDLVYVIIRKGWPKEDEEITRWLNSLFAGDWVQNLEKAVQLPLGMFEDPRLWVPDSRQRKAHLGPYAAQYFTCRALQLQNQGQEEKALDHLRIVLALSRQLGNQANYQLLDYAGQVQELGLKGLNRWLDKVGPNPARLRAALVMLQEHEKQWPPFADCLKAQYVIEMKGELIPEATLQVFATALQVPWEKERHERLIRAINFSDFQRSERALHPRPFEVGEKKYYPPRSYEWYAIYNGILPDSHLTARLSLRRWGKIIATSISGISGGNMAGLMAREYLPRLRDRRAAQLQIALALYQGEHGQPAAKLDDLVPKYLPAMPLDPFSGEPFNYRISQGEELEIEVLYGEPHRKKLQANQGLIWSRETSRGDVYSRYFPVPVWPKR